MNKIVVVSLNNKHHSDGKETKKTAEKILQLLKKENCRLEIFLINSRKMRILNKKFRGKNKTPGILSFTEPKNFPHPESKLKPLGEIYLNQSSVISHQPSAIGLLVHGILHLLGFTHSPKMEKKEREVIDKLKIKN